MSTTLERLCVILLKNHKVQPECLRLDVRLESLGIDSLGTVELLWNIEEAFHITLPSAAVEVHTLGDVVGLVDALLARPAPSLPVAPGLGLP